MPAEPPVAPPLAPAITDPVADATGGLLPGLGAEPGLALVLYHKHGAEVSRLPAGGDVIVGRAAPADVVVPDPQISRRHARFQLAGEEVVVVEDLGSTNGTWRDGARIERAELRVGDEVTLGGGLLARIRRLGPMTDAPVGPGDPIVAGPAMRDLVETARRVAAARLPVILQGETGTGKEVFATLIHEASPRRGKPMLRVDCGAIPAERVESTLFGHEPGALPGAVDRRRGVFEEADGGTVFLDEIAELPLPVQASLLRLLETGWLTRAGATQEIHVDVRVIAGTHRPLPDRVAEGAFREDLHHRLNAITLDIPPLRSRASDVEPLAMRFLKHANEVHGRSIRGIAPGALATLERYAWPRNVRELKNAIEHAVVVARAEFVRELDLPAAVRDAMAPERAPAPPPSSPMTSRGEHSTERGPVDDGVLKARVQRFEAQLIVDALRASGWRPTEAARLLGMPVRTLTHKMKVLGVKKEG